MFSMVRLIFGSLITVRPSQGEDVVKEYTVTISEVKF